MASTGAYIATPLLLKANPIEYFGEISNSLSLERI